MNANRRYSAQLLREQLALIFRAWGMSDAHIATTVRYMVESDLRGVESHGVTMMRLYAEHFAAGKLNMKANVRAVRDQGAIALIDGDGGLGHVPSAMAMTLAVNKAHAFGVGAVAVRNSNHFGAAGVYAQIATDAGCIGLVGTSAWNSTLVPTFGSKAVLGTNPLAFGAPAKRNAAFLLDMATTTAAVGKLRIAQMQRKAIPAGWSVDESGAPITDPGQALKLKWMTPLGASRVMGSHKGYGLAAMVEILSATLAGASFTPLRKADAAYYDIGHFMLAIEPKAFRDEGEFEHDMDSMIDFLHATPPVDPAEPVQVAGDAEAACVKERLADGIPLYADQYAMLERLCREYAVEFLLPQR